MKKCEIIIKYCNCACPYFYHKFSDNESIYCDKLKRKIFEMSYDDDVMWDLKPRQIPEFCPLDDVKDLDGVK